MPISCDIKVREVKIAQRTIHQSRIAETIFTLNFPVFVAIFQSSLII